MRTHPQFVVTTVPTDSISLTAVSVHWLLMAAVGAVAATAVAIALLIISSAAYRTIPTIGRAVWQRDHILTPAAVFACALLLASLCGANQELAALRDGALFDTVEDTQFALAASHATTDPWDCEVVELHDSGGTATVSCSAPPASPAADTSGP